MEDIVPELIKRLQLDFQTGISNNPIIQNLRNQIAERKGSYADAEDIAKELGAELSQAFGKNVSSATLPDGKMHFNIADRTLRPMLQETYGMAAQEAIAVQKVINEKSCIGLKVQEPLVDEDRVEGIINIVSDAESFDDVAWILKEPLINFALSAVTDVVAVNFEFHGATGLSPYIIRKSEGKCCKWCRNLAGTYSYPLEDRVIYQRHQRCRCSVMYDSGNGIKQNVHTKSVQVSRFDALRETRKMIGVQTGSFKVRGFSNNAIGSLKERLVTPDDLKDVFANPLHIKHSVETNITQIIGGKCTITMDANGKVLTAYPTHSKTAQMYRAKN